MLPPGPRLPVALQTVRAWRATLPFFDAATRRFGPIFTIRALPWGTVVVVNDTRAGQGGVLRRPGGLPRR